jgi:hypothetical protein
MILTIGLVPIWQFFFFVVEFNIMYFFNAFKLNYEKKMPLVNLINASCY